MAAHEVNAKFRVRDRILERIDELGMTGREFAGKLGYKDGWFNAIKKGRNALALADLDAAATALRTTPGDLVRRGEEAWDLRPSEMRQVRALRLLPHVIQDYLITLTDYLVGIYPEEIAWLNEYRELTEKQQSRIRHWTHVMLLAGDHDQDSSTLDNLGEITDVPTGPRRGKR